MQNSFKMPRGKASIAGHAFIAVTCLGLAILPAAAIAKGANAGGASASAGSMQKTQSRNMDQTRTRTEARVRENCDGGCDTAARVQNRTRTEQRHEFRKTLSKLNGLFGTDSN